MDPDIIEALVSSALALLVGYAGRALYRALSSGALSIRVRRRAELRLVRRSALSRAAQRSLSAWIAMRLKQRDAAERATTGPGASKGGHSAAPYGRDIGGAPLGPPPQEKPAGATGEPFATYQPGGWR